MSKQRLPTSWGLQPDRPCWAAWGARAIWSEAKYTERRPIPGAPKPRTRREQQAAKKYEAFIDLLWDRQGMVGAEQDRKLLQAWLNDYALPALRTLVVDENLHQDEDRVLVVEGFDPEGRRMRLIANPSRSYGYLYLCGMMLAPTSAGKLVQEHGDKLIGRIVRTVQFGDWPGGNARVVNLGEDPNAPEIVMNVESTEGHGPIGVFEYEPIELVTEPEEKCPGCQRTVAEDATLCPNCGHDLCDDAEPEQNAQPPINRDKIQNALAFVHANEKTMGRAHAVHHARVVTGLNEAELAILCNATNVNASELPAKGEGK